MCDPNQGSHAQSTNHIHNLNHYGAVHLDALTLCRCQIDSGGNLLCNINNMAQIRLNTTERDVDLPRRADLRLNMACFCQKCWQMH